ncbi:MAG: hypothetical protein PHG06_09555 [Parabacteroides sp.]|nr:hypothetical protein [Parabacteroides sp.]
MIFDKLLEIREFEDLPYKLETVQKNDEIIILNGNAIIPILGIRQCYDISENIEVKDQDGNILGILCKCKDRHLEVSEMTEWEYYAFLFEADELTAEYQFKNNYIVINESRIDEYKSDYYFSAPLWGGFYHENINIQPHKKTVSEICAVKNINLPTSYHKENSIRSVDEIYSFERFLKSYHLLELLFEFDFVNSIKSLPDDIKGIGEILNKYNNKEIVRLKSIVNSRCSNISKIGDSLNTADNFKDKAKKIFWDYGKDSNPIKDESEFDFYLQGNFDLEGFKRKHRTSPQNESIKYREFIVSVSTYFIYRIRCSIVHNRIGEYVMTYDDEEFVCDFGEPLLNEILVQAFIE